jgi:hypothetical protein
VLDVIKFEHRDVSRLLTPAVDERQLGALQTSDPISQSRNHCIWSSIVENAAFSLRAFLISVALAYGYSAYSRKLGH